MTRKKFMESLGATCANWTWSWSFVNHDERFVVFGAWDVEEEGHRCKILDASWQFKDDGKKNGGFQQAKRHISLCENHGYRLKTFRQFRAEGNPETGTSRIKGFERIVTDRVLVSQNEAWYAYPSGLSAILSEDIGRMDDVFYEGARTKVVSEKVERNREARAKCIDLYGLDCSVCSMNFNDMYGQHGDGYIHIHHLFPISNLNGAHVVDPEKDLRPVCPNCHAMLHRGRAKNPMSIEELKSIVDAKKSS